VTRVLVACAVQVGEVVEPLLLELSLRQLRCPTFEKRLAGLLDISDIAMRASRLDYLKCVVTTRFLLHCIPMPYLVPYRLVLPELCTALKVWTSLATMHQRRGGQTLRMWRRGSCATRYGARERCCGRPLPTHPLLALLRTAASSSTAQVVEFLFGPALHAELVKRSLDLLVFLATPPNCVLTVAHLELMWSACSGKHGVVGAPASDCLCELLPNLPSALLEVRT
jgi:hypothetical protein